MISPHFFILLLYITYVVKYCNIYVLCCLSERIPKENQDAKGIFTQRKKAVVSYRF